MYAAGSGAVSVLFNEPKLLKFFGVQIQKPQPLGFSALQRAEIAEIRECIWFSPHCGGFSALQRAEIAEIVANWTRKIREVRVSVLFNEPKLLKSREAVAAGLDVRSFSALQRAEIAEIGRAVFLMLFGVGFSALQRAEIAEIACGILAA